MSRTLNSCLVLLLILGLAACGSNEPENAGAPASVVPAEPEDPVEIDGEDDKAILPPIEVSTEDNSESEPVPDEEFEIEPNRG